MQTVRGVVSNSILNSAVEQALADLKRGNLLSVSLEKTGRFPSLAVSMIGVGEETGRLGQMLEKVGHLYDRELRKGIKTFSSFFEPVVLLVMGTLIGGMVISMLMAIFSINDMNM
jgi:general secretion pathway protein F